jgi:lysophospholipase L1-like esterase
MMRTHRTLRRLAGVVAVPAVAFGLLAGSIVAGPESPAAAQTLATQTVATRTAGMHATDDETSGGQAGPLKIMPLGDSITWGVGSMTHSSYRDDLSRRLAGAGLDVDFVGSQKSGAGLDDDNEGHPGWTIAGISQQLDGWLATYTPDVILLHIGTNDMRTAGRAAGATTRLSMLLDQIQADRPDAQVFVAELVGAGDDGDSAGHQHRVDAYNAQVGPIVASKGANFHLVDQSRIRGIDMADRLHPNDFGYAEMSYNWYRALSATLNTTGTAWPADRNPFRATAAVRCIDQSDRWFARYATGCHTWYRRAAGVWQLPVRTVVKYKVTKAGKTVVRARATVRWITGS